MNSNYTLPPLDDLLSVDEEEKDNKIDMFPDVADTAIQENTGLSESTNEDADSVLEDPVAPSLTEDTLTTYEPQELLSLDDIPSVDDVPSTDIPVDTEVLDPRVDALMNDDFDFAEENIDNIYNEAVKIWERERALKDGRYYKVEVEDITNIQLGDDVRKPTREEVLRDYMLERENRAFMVNDMLQSDNPIRKELASTLVDQGYSPLTITYIIEGAEWSPFLGAALGIADIPENVANARQAYEDGEYGVMAVNLGISAAELAFTITGTKQLAKPVVGALKNKTLGARRMAKINEATDAELRVKAEAAKKVADENQDIAEQIITEYEETMVDATGKQVTVSTVVDGRKVMDFEAAKEHGRTVAEDVKAMQDLRAAEFAKSSTEANAKWGVGEVEAFSGLTEEVDELVTPLLNAEKFNAIVAIASDLKKTNPSAFSKDKTIIESLFDLTTDNKIGFKDSQELADMLNKYGLSFDDYVNMVVTGGSEAGKILQKLSQIRRAGSVDDLRAMKEKLRQEGQNDILKTWRRIENLRRGGMVSMVKTAFRNAGSFAIRAPLETLENVSDSIMYEMSQKFQKRNDIGYRKAVMQATWAGAKTAISPKQWYNSTKMLQRVVANPVMARDVTDFILKRPEFIDKHKNLFDMVNEYQVATGRGEGGAVDATLTKLEDVVNALNTPNRIQEFTIRRAAFMGELERLVSRHYDKSLMTMLEEGKIGDLIANASSVRPKGAPTFEQLIEDSTKKALDITYASPPEITALADFSNWLTRNGLTAVTTPFPRFMFKSMELMGQYGGGALNVGIRKAFNVNGKKWGDALDAKDRQLIGRNLTGWSAIYAAYQYRVSEGSPADHKEMITDEGKVWDTTSFFPLRQAMWIGEAIKRGMWTPFGTRDEGESAKTLAEWIDVKEVQEVFLGTAARTGTANIYVEEITNIIADSGDPASSESFKKLLSRNLANYLRTWTIPLTQVPELQRATGYRPATYTEQAEDRDTLNENYLQAAISETARSMRTAGVSNIFTPSKEFEREQRVDVFTPDRQRLNMGLGLVAGVTQYTMDSDDGEYLKRKGLSKWEMSSKSRIPSRQAVENLYLQKYLPKIIDGARSFETILRKDYLKEPSLKEEGISIDKYVNQRIVPYLNKQKGALLKASESVSAKDTDRLLVAHEDYRRMGKKTRALGFSEYIRRFGEPPNMAELKDVLKLIETSKKASSAFGSK